MPTDAVTAAEQALDAADRMRELMIDRGLDPDEDVLLAFTAQVALRLSGGISPDSEQQWEDAFLDYVDEAGRSRAGGAPAPRLGRGRAQDGQGAPRPGLLAGLPDRIAEQAVCQGWDFRHDLVVDRGLNPADVEPAVVNWEQCEAGLRWAGECIGGYAPVPTPILDVDGWRRCEHAARRALELGHSSIPVPRPYVNDHPRAEHHQRHDQAVGVRAVRRTGDHERGHEIEAAAHPPVGDRLDADELAVEHRGDWERRPAGVFSRGPVRVPGQGAQRPGARAASQCDRRGGRTVRLILRATRSRVASP